MSGFDLIINEDFSESVFRESYMNGGNQQDFINILFQYPSIQLNRGALQFANTLCLFSETVHFSLSINPYCILTKEYYDQVTLGVTSSMKQLVKLSLNFGDHCCLRDLSFFSILKNLSNKLKEFSFELGEQNILDDEQIQHLDSFIQSQQSLSVLKIKIKDRNYFTNRGFILFSQSLQALESLVELSIYLNMSRIDETAVNQFSISLSKLNHLNIFQFVDSSQSLFFPGIQDFFRAILSLINLQTLNITFMYNKLLQTNVALEFFEGISNLKQLQKLILKGFDLSQVDFGSTNCSFLIQKETLQVCELDFDRISQQNGLISFLYKDLQLLTSLKQLNINISKHSFIQESGCLLISEGISKIISLEKLNLQIQQGNRIGIEGLYSIGKAIANLGFLSHLDLFIDDQNDQEMNGLKHLFNGIKCSINLIEFNFKLICKQSQGSSQVCSFLGETFSNLKSLQNIELYIETKSIYLNNVQHFCSGLSTLIDLRQLKVYFSAQRLDCLEPSIFQAIQNHKQLKVLRVSCNQREEYDTELQMQIVIGRFEHLTELYLNFKIGKLLEDERLIKEGFESMKQLKVLSLKFVLKRFKFFGQSMQKFIEHFSLPSSIETFKFEFQSLEKTNTHLFTDFHKMFRNLKNLKVLIIDFQYKKPLHSVHDISKCLLQCQNLVCLSLKLNCILSPKEIEYLSESLSSLIHLRELQLNIPNFVGVDQTQTQRLKDSIGSLKKLYKYTENIKLFEKPQTQQYDHILLLPNLVQYNHNEQNYSDFEEQITNHLATSKYDCQESKEIIESTIPQDNCSLKSRNITQLGLTFFDKMTPLCYLEILQNLKHFKQLKELTLNFSKRVYLSRQEVSQIRVGLSQLIHLTSLSIKCNFDNQYSTFNKKIIFALGVGLQNISQLENLALEIVKPIDSSHSDYFAKLAKGIKNQKKLLNLELKMKGLNWLEWQSFNLKDVLQNIGKLRTLRLSFSERFTDSNLIQLGEALHFQNELITLSILLNSYNSISTEATLSINRGIKLNNKLQSISFDIVNSRTGDSSSLRNILNVKNSDNQFLQEFNVRFIVEDKISTEVLEEDIHSIEKFKQLKKLKYEILFSRSHNINKIDSIETFFESFFNTVQIPSGLSIECTQPVKNLKRIETNLKIKTNNQCNFEFQFQFGSALFENTMDLLIPLSKTKRITKLKCCYPKYQIEQPASFFKMAHYQHLTNLLEFHLLVHNQSSPENLFDLFALGMSSMVNLRTLSLYFFYRKNFEVENFNYLISSLIELKYFSILKIYIGQSNYYNTIPDYKKQSFKEYLRLSELTNLKYLELVSFDQQLSSSVLSKHLKSKMRKLVYVKLTQYRFGKFDNIIEQFQNDAF